MVVSTNKVQDGVNSDSDLGGQIGSTCQSHHHRHIDTIYGNSDGDFNGHFDWTITARIRRMGKVLFSQVCVCSHGGAPSLSHNTSIYWFHVLSGRIPHSIILPLVPCPFQGVCQSQVGVSQSQGATPDPGRGSTQSQVGCTLVLGRTGWDTLPLSPPPQPG